MNNKGQALVEFVLILPIFILILFVIVDFGMVINTKSTLENDSVDITLLYRENKNLNEIKNLYPDILIYIEEDNDYIRLSLEKEVDIITPGLNRILGDPYNVKIERVIYND